MSAVSSVIGAGIGLAYGAMPALIMGLGAATALPAVAIAAFIAALSRRTP